MLCSPSCLQDDLREFLEERVDEDYAMPLNPIWCVRDPGWFDVLEAQMQTPGGTNSARMKSIFCAGSAVPPPQAAHGTWIPGFSCLVLVECPPCGGGQCAPWFCIVSCSSLVMYTV